MINQPWGKRNWFSHIQVSLFLARSSKTYFYKFYNEPTTTFDLNLVCSWWESAAPKHKDGFYPSDTKWLTVKTTDGVNRQLINQYENNKNPQQHEKITQIDDFFTAMKKARLM